MHALRQDLTSYCGLLVSLVLFVFSRGGCQPAGGRAYQLELTCNHHASIYLSYLAAVLREL